MDVNKPVKEFVELGVREILRDIPVSRLRVLPCQVLRIETTETGIYRLYYQQLVKAGMPAAIIPENLQLFNQGKEVAVTINLPEQFLEFYAESKVYWLYFGEDASRKGFGTD
ncbi:hypothetical protein [Candidatus Marithrix sp. Canyon 246]|uniref:hypothetical protein n=1 Tax=Candidatus Marithrix sp. Canyon 246 TaxID=1827136 RepID=UPI00084A1FA5|nr:hypothetical protein [Candidatus Marithrix sp. Canyon 246]